MTYFVVGPDGAEHGPVEIGTLIEWAKAGTLPRGAPIRQDGSAQTVYAGEMIELAAHFAPVAGYTAAPSGSAMMPSGNPDALWGYYLGFASILCVIGLAAAPFAYSRSIKGLKRYQSDPSVHGKAHAVVGIVLASLGTIGNLFLLSTIIAGLMAAG